MKLASQKMTFWNPDNKIETPVEEVFILFLFPSTVTVFITMIKQQLIGTMLDFTLSVLQAGEIKQLCSRDHSQWIPLLTTSLNSLIYLATRQIYEKRQVNLSGHYREKATLLHHPVQVKQIPLQIGSSQQPYKGENQRMK